MDELKASPAALNTAGAVLLGWNVTATSATVMIPAAIAPIVSIKFTESLLLDDGRVDRRDGVECLWSVLECDGQ